MKIHFKALGCRLNEAELEQWSQQFQAEGHSISQDANTADLLVFNSCAVTHEASRKSRRLINRLHRDNPQAKLVITGCHASLNPEEVADTLGVDLVVSNDQKSELPTLVIESLDLPSMPLSATEPDDIALYQRGRHRAFIKVQDGCRYRCTYCIVTLARGKEKSRSIADCVSEIRALNQQGIQEAVLTGVHVGGYGSDLGSSLYELIQAILNDTDLPRLRLASVEPWDLPDNFFELFKNPRLMPHMHLPLQSGSDTVLRRMARRCKTTEFAELVQKARQAIADFNITTDIIVGFPGETESDWQQTLKFVEDTGFGHLHIFPYSPREGTKAARLPAQIEKSIKQKRCKELATLGEAMKLEILQQSRNNTSEVLWERPSSAENGYHRFTGYTENYLRVETLIPEKSDLEYSITPAKTVAINKEKLTLEMKVEENYYRDKKLSPAIIPITAIG